MKALVSRRLRRRRRIFLSTELRLEFRHEYGIRRLRTRRLVLASGVFVFGLTQTSQKTQNFSYNRTGLSTQSGLEDAEYAHAGLCCPPDGERERSDA